MIRRVVFIRHGETVDNARGVAQGWSDSELSARGIDQVTRLAQRVKQLAPTALYASTLMRARTTAERIAAAVDLPVRLLDDLREMNCGEWEGVNFELVKRTQSDFFLKWANDPRLACPGGESFHDVRTRLRSALQQIRENEATPEDACVVIVSHGTAIRIAATEMLGLPLEFARNFAQDNTAINVFDWRVDRYILKVWNDATHCGG
jgi:broad specificity phosphatase PhoE